MLLAPALAAEPPAAEPSLEARAEQAYQARRLLEAISLYRELLQEKPEDLSLQLRLAQLYRWAEQPAKAQGVYQSVLTRHPENPEARAGLAFCQAAQGDLRAAQAAYEAMRADDPRNADVLLGLGRIYLRNGDWPRAREALDQGLALNPDYRDLREARRSLDWRCRPQLEVRATLHEETEQDRSTHRDIVGYRQTDLETGFSMPWASRQTTEIDWRLSRRNEENFAAHQDNYDVTQETQSLKHTARSPQGWTSMTFLGNETFSDRGANTYPLGWQREFTPYSQTLVFQRAVHRASLTQSRESLLIKEFSDTTTDILAVDTTTLAYGYQPDSLWRLDASVDHAHYERANGRDDVEFSATRWWDGLPGFSTLAGWRYRQFDRDVAEYYSFDQRQQWMGRLSYDTPHPDRWRISGSYTFTYADIRERVNPSLVAVPSASAIVSSIEPVHNNTHELSLRLEALAHDRFHLYLAPAWSLNSDHYRTWGISLGCNVLF